MKSIIFVLLIATFARQNLAMGHNGSHRREFSEEVATQTTTTTTTTTPEPMTEDRQLQCGQNEKLHICGNQCDLTVWNYGKPFITRGECREECVCQRGFVRNERGRCVMNSFPCYENEEFRRCETHCEMGCDCRGEIVKYVTMGCQQGQSFKSGYRCKPGYVRHLGSKKCVPNFECVPQV